MYLNRRYAENTAWPFQSNQCVPKSKVCDSVVDCTFHEDEKYCINLFNSDSIRLKVDGRPQRPSSGLVAFNTKGHWTPVCTRTWSDSLERDNQFLEMIWFFCRRNPQLNDQICKYMNFQGAQSYQLVSTERRPHIKNKILRVR